MKARLAAALIVLALAGSRSGTAPSPTDEGLLYLMPLWNGLIVLPPEGVAAEVSRLRTRIGEGGPVRVGFAQTIPVEMPAWPVASEAEALAALVPTIAAMDEALQAARTAGIPVALLFLTPIRDLLDDAQTMSQSEDRRVMQWYDDNSLADGWWTFSRYARQQYAVREIYLRALGRVVANRMALFPDTFVAAAGDGEIELAFPGQGTLETPPEPISYADYSPFAIAEFRDWLRGEGLYGPGQPFDGQAYGGAARYRGQPTPALLNSDFGTGFTTWDLRYEPWTLEDTPGADDPNAIPAATYTAAGWTPEDAGALHFDAPRTKGNPNDGWWNIWFQFRVFLVARYNLDFAKWMTTTADPATGLTVPASRWYSYQIPADYLFGHSPSVPDRRYLTSASSWTTADIRPFGNAGITAFNVTDGVNTAYTLANVSPLISGLGTRWGILEWNPSVPSSTNPALYRAEMAIVERDRPTLLVPYQWDDPLYQVLDSGFETALKELVDRMKGAPWNLRAEVTGAQVRLTWAAPEQGAAPNQYRLEVGTGPSGPHLLTLDTGSRSTILSAVGGPGTYYVRVHAIRGAQVSSGSNLVRVVIGGSAASPGAPGHLVAVTTGSTITFNWLAPAGGTPPTGYVIEAGSAVGLSNLARMNLPAATTFTIPNVPAGTYHVRVRAANGAATGAASNDVTVSSGPGAGHCTPVDPPGTISFSLAGRQVSFAWDGPLRGAQPSGYVLEAGSAPGQSNLAVLGLGPSRAFSVGAPPGTFYLRLRAVGPCGTSTPGPDVRLDVP